MFTAIVSIAGLIASAYLGRRELTRRKESGDRSGMGWGITFCIMQAIAVALGFLGMAPDDILSPHYPERRAHRLRLGLFRA